MSLILIFHNDGTGLWPDVGNYNVKVMVNQRMIAQGRVENHQRNEGWEKLVEKFLQGILNEKEANHHPGT